MRSLLRSSIVYGLWLMSSNWKLLFLLMIPGTGYLQQYRQRKRTAGDKAATSVGTTRDLVSEGLVQPGRAWKHDRNACCMATPLCGGDGAVRIGVPPSLHVLANSQRSVGGLDTLNVAIKLEFRSASNVRLQTL